MYDPADHLNAEARAALKLTDDKRIVYIKHDRWIGYTLAKEFIEDLEEVLAHPKTSRMPCRLLVSYTNNGKTKLIERFQSKHPANDNPNGDKIIVPVLVIQAPPVPDEGRLYDEILATLGAPYRQTDRPAKKQFQVITLLEALNVLMLIIDEIHDMLAGGAVHQRQVCNAIKHLSNRVKIPILGAGTHDAFNVIHSDPQLANRFKPMVLPKWGINDKVEPKQDPFLKLLSSFGRMLPLSKPSKLAEATIAVKLLSMSEGLIGELSEILKLAAIKAIKSKKELIDVDLLDKLKWVSPSDRKWKLNK
jgi:hypothetical protein